MKPLKNILEGILDDIDTGINNMDKDLEKSLNVPTKKDFERSDWSRDVHAVKWYCPHIMDKYKNKYSFMFDNNDGICISCRTGYHGRAFNISLIYDDDTWRQNYLQGWEIPWFDLDKMSLPQMKKLAIELITHLAHHPNALDALFKQTAEYKKCDGRDFSWKDLRDLLKIK